MEVNKFARSGDTFSMPTLLSWVFDGGDADPDASQRMQERATRRGDKQRVYSGDAVDDDLLGVGGGHQNQ